MTALLYLMMKSFFKLAIFKSCIVSIFSKPPSSMNYLTRDISRHTLGIGLLSKSSPLKNSFMKRLSSMRRSFCSSMLCKLDFSKRLAAIYKGLNFLVNSSFVIDRPDWWTMLSRKKRKTSSLRRDGLLIASVVSLAHVSSIQLRLPRISSFKMVSKYWLSFPVLN